MRSYDSPEKRYSLLRRTLRLLHSPRRAFSLHNLNYLLDLGFKKLWVREFHRLWYYSNVWANNIRWLGVEVQQNPMDMWVLQEIIFETKPDYLIETGTRMGGSALFFATIFDLIGHGHVITIDIKNSCLVNHPRITALVANSISEDTVSRVRQIVGHSRSMVFLDSLHNSEHVLKELEFYKRFVSPSCYLVVADTNIDGHPVLSRYSEVVDGTEYFGGPLASVMKFVRMNPTFRIDRGREKNMHTLFPSGFLLRTQ